MCCTVYFENAFCSSSLRSPSLFLLSPSLLCTSITLPSSSLLLFPLFLSLLFSFLLSFSLSPSLPFPSLPFPFILTPLITIHVTSKFTLFSLSPLSFTLCTSDCTNVQAYVTVRLLEESGRENDEDEDKEEEDDDHDIDNPESCAAILRDTIVTVTTSLPSIVQADPELTLEFFANLLEGLSVQHDSKSRTNTCHFNTK